jgi:DNA mismatch repair protein MutS
MSGKSSYLRQNALICLLAQIGSFVPAEKAELCIVDRIFTRVGASDNLTQGVSTFMAEMQEAANILNNATDKSLIILDELGRGTSTYDGVSIAWAIMEHIHENIKAKTIFATHYHELTDVVEKLERAENYCVAVSESGGKVVFLHQIIKGASSDSYGIEVAKLAGLPDELINKANEILQALEQRESTAQPRAQQSALPLQLTSEEKAVVKRISDMDVDQMTPLEALQRISNLKKSLDNVL